MARVMPSQVVQAIDGLFPHAGKQQSNALLTIGNGPQLRAILKLLSDVPEELIALPLADYADLILAKSTIEETLAHWHAPGDVGGMSYVNGFDAVTAREGMGYNPTNCVDRKNYRCKQDEKKNHQKGSEYRFKHKHQVFLPNVAINSGDYR